MKENSMKNFFRRAVNKIIRMGFLNFLSDEQFLKLRYRIEIGKKLDLKNPQTFNEKLQWLKLYNRNPEYTKMVDKYEVRKYIAEKIGEEYLIPLLGVWDKFDDIDFDSLPNQFVLKCTHDSGGLVICKDKTKLDLDAAKKRIERSLKRKFFYIGREWPYKNIKPQIIAEKFIEEDTVLESKSLVVYKVFCFNSGSQIIQVIQNDKRPDETIDYFDAEWNLLDLKQDHPNSEKHIEKNNCLNEMLAVSQKLADGIPFLRVDWYISKGRLLFSEFTFYSDCGFAKFTPEEWDDELGKRIVFKNEK